MRSLLLIFLVFSSHAWAGPYLELGGGVTNDRIWIYGDDGKIEETGKIGFAALGYSYPVLENFFFDLQYRHESDPTRSNVNDLTARDSLNLSSRVVLLGAYVELGGGFTEDRIWVDDERGQFQESGIIGLAAFGFDYAFEDFSIDLQYRYEDDPKSHSEKDLTNRDSLNLAARLKF